MPAGDGHAGDDHFPQPPAGAAGPGSRPGSRGSAGSPFGWRDWANTTGDGGGGGRLNSKGEHVRLRACPRRVIAVTV
jgi:hypothetical protein